VQPSHGANGIGTVFIQVSGLFGLFSLTKSALRRCLTGSCRPASEWLRRGRRPFRLIRVFVIFRHGRRIDGVDRYRQHRDIGHAKEDVLAVLVFEMSNEIACAPQKCCPRWLLQAELNAVAR